jgi:hypothetical protein
VGKENDDCGYNNSEVRHDGSLENIRSVGDIHLLKEKVLTEYIYIYIYIYIYKIVFIEKSLRRQHM